MPEKHSNYCVNGYGGQKNAPQLLNSENNVAIEHLLKIALNMPMELCNHCQYHLYDSILTLLTLSVSNLQSRALNVSS